ncbi:MAG: hypothetical protein PW788_02105 [Micavibrio sp.]|nr:hypothetical protein [Micavibrio sp.]
MSISEFFNKKARAAAASLALVFGVAGGYAGHELAQAQFQPQLSDFTLSGVPDNATQQQFTKGHIPGAADAEAATTRFTFAQRLDTLEELASMADDTSDPIILQQLQHDAVAFINDLRINTHLSEQDYARLVADYDDRVGLDVTPITGNYRNGAMYQQEGMIAAQFGAVFGGEELTATEQSKAVGEMMQLGQDSADKTGLEGGLAGAALGGLVALPLLRRTRRKGPQVKK